MLCSMLCIAEARSRAGVYQTPALRDHGPARGLAQACCDAAHTAMLCAASFGLQSAVSRSEQTARPEEAGRR